MTPLVLRLSAARTHPCPGPRPLPRRARVDLVQHELALGVGQDPPLRHPRQVQRDAGHHRDGRGAGGQRQRPQERVVLGRGHGLEDGPGREQDAEGRRVLRHPVDPGPVRGLRGQRRVLRVRLASVPGVAEHRQQQPLLFDGRVRGVRVVGGGQERGVGGPRGGLRRHGGGGERAHPLRDFRIQDAADPPESGGRGGQRHELAHGAVREDARGDGTAEVHDVLRGAHARLLVGVGAADLPACVRKW